MEFIGKAIAILVTIAVMAVVAWLTLPAGVMGR